MSVRMILAETPLFGGLSSAECDALAAFFRSHLYRKGAVIFSEGDPGTTLYLIQDGEVKLTILSPDGKEVILALLGSGGFFGELALLDGGMRSATAVARSPSKLLVLERVDLLRFLGSHPNAVAPLLAALSRRLRRTTDLTHDAVFLDGPTRLTKVLLRLAQVGDRERLDPDGVVSAPRLTQEELAELVGGTRESINRWLRILAREGFVRRRRGVVEVLDPERLRKRLPRLVNTV